MGWAAIIQAIVQGVSNLVSTVSYIKENKTQAKEIAAQAQEQADQRAKAAKYNMQQQKTSFLKSGVYFNSGSALDVINETYNTAMEDIAAVDRDSLSQQKKLIRANRTALIQFLIDPAKNNGADYANSIYQGFKNNASNTGSEKVSISKDTNGQKVGTSGNKLYASNNSGLA